MLAYRSVSCISAKKYRYSRSQSSLHLVEVLGARSLSRSHARRNLSIGCAVAHAGSSALPSILIASATQRHSKLGDAGASSALAGANARAITHVEARDIQAFPDRFAIRKPRVENASYETPDRGHRFAMTWMRPTRYDPSPVGP